MIEHTLSQRNTSGNSLSFPQPVRRHRSARGKRVSGWCHRLLAGVMLLCLSASPLRAENILPFTTETLAQIRAELKDQGFILSLWSVTCAPCREDLAILAALREQHPDLPVILVSTDPIADMEDAVWVLEDYGLEEMRSWMFADSFAEPLRHSIDPQWYGELPRSYFYAPDHSARAHSGVLRHEILTQHMDTLLREGPGHDPGQAHHHP